MSDEVPWKLKVTEGTVKTLAYFFCHTYELQVVKTKGLQLWLTFTLKTSVSCGKEKLYDNSESTIVDRTAKKLAETHYKAL